MYVHVKEFGDLLLAGMVLRCTQGRGPDHEASVLYGRTAALCHPIHCSVFMWDPFLLTFFMRGSTSECRYWSWVSGVAGLIFSSWFTLKCNDFTRYIFGLQVISLKKKKSVFLVHLVNYSGVKKCEGGSSQKLNSWELDDGSFSCWKIQPIAYIGDLLYLK